MANNQDAMLESMHNNIKAIAEALGVSVEDPLDAKAKSGKTARNFWAPGGAGHAIGYGEEHPKLPALPIAMLTAPTDEELTDPDFGAGVTAGAETALDLDKSESAGSGIAQPKKLGGK